MSKKRKVFIIVFNSFILFLVCFYCFKTEDNKPDFYNVETNEIAYFYIPNKIIYVQGGSANLNAVFSFDDYELGNGVYLDSAKDNRGKDLFLNLASDIYIPIEDGGTDLTDNKPLGLADYHFISPLLGSYQVFVKRDSVLNNDSNISFLIDEKQIWKNSGNCDNKEEDWCLWNEVNLPQGSHRLTIFNGESEMDSIKSRDMILKHSRTRQIFSSPLKFARINSTKYIVKLEKLPTQPFLLVFLEGFNPNWKVYLNSSPPDSYHFWETWFSKPLIGENHFMINGYANSWLIDPDASEGVDTAGFIIDYWPQKFFYLAIVIVCLTLLFCINCLIIFK